MIEEVLEARRYVEAKAVYDSLADMDDKSRAKALSDPMIQRVRDIDFELAEEEIEGEGDDG